ncbi:metaxin-2-like [Homalodisca vitripennis]|uniref:metaxin-2-like n=1 Tax=Homalodisca vitripennis TaxID=197043 RepID=UPI001EEA5750|nr:metaxin-2-like [Homalodisca vitripennis]
MPVILVTNSVECEVGANEPWPEDVKLFQPFETEQILLPDNASCLSVQAFLRMCNLKYEVVYKKNAENMSPSGRVPFIKCGAFIISELEPLTSFVANKGISLTGGLDNVQKADMRAYMSLIITVLANAENYLTWVDRDTYNQVTKVRYGSVHPWPLNWLLTRQKRHMILKRLNALGWLDKTIEQVYDEVDSCCTALSERLDDNKYFFGDKPTELDAMVFAHVFTILTTPLPSNQFATTIRCYPKIIEHCQRIEKEFFSGQNSNKI